MITVLTDLPDNVLGFEAKGEVTGDDYEQVLIPAVEKHLETAEKIRLLYVLGEGSRTIRRRRSGTTPRSGCPT
jgi:hypothetical protein